jgi:hypothetical protein
MQNREVCICKLHILKWTALSALVPWCHFLTIGYTMYRVSRPWSWLVSVKVLLQRNGIVLLFKLCNFPCDIPCPSGRFMVTTIICNIVSKHGTRDPSNDNFEFLWNGKEKETAFIFIFYFQLNICRTCTFPLKLIGRSCETKSMSFFK